MQPCRKSRSGCNANSGSAHWEGLQLALLGQGSCCCVRGSCHCLQHALRVLVSQYNKRYSPLAAGTTRARACGPTCPACPWCLSITKGTVHQLPGRHVSGLVGRYHGLAHLLLPTCCRWGRRIVCGLRAQRLRHGGSWGGHPGLCVGALPPCSMSSLSSRSSSNSSKSSGPSSAVALSAFGMRPLRITLLMRWISLHYKRSNLMAATSGDGLGQHWMIWRGFVTCKLRLSCLSRTSYELNHKAHLRHDRKHFSSQIGYAACRAFRAVTGTMLAMYEESGGRATQRTLKICWCSLAVICGLVLGLMLWLGAGKQSHLLFRWGLLGGRVVGKGTLLRIPVSMRGASEGL